ncbi:putative MFS monocarboxylate transporter [Xylariaceae sp. FL1272]|nr:putative MFS monocarboxylate transporter [Xylariaceae sp. FL1272]
MARPLLAKPEEYDSLRSWLAVAGASLVLYCTNGFINAFGVYQEYYAAGLLKGYTESDISWIGSVSIFLLYVGSPMAGVLTDRVGATILLTIGSIGQLLAIFLSSLCTQYYQLFLAQAVLLGASMSLSFAPSIAVVSRRMPHRRGLALGFVIGGASIGGLVWPIMLERLLYDSDIGFAWTQRAVGFVMLPLLGIACLTVVDVPARASTTTAVEPSPTSREGEGSVPQNDEKPKAQHPVIAVMKNTTFCLLCCGLFVTYLGFFTPFFYISSYAIERGISSSTGFYLISALNGASFFGRVLPGHLADAYGHFNVLTVSILLSGVIGLTWTTAFTLPGMVIWTIAYGFTSGAVISLQSACAGKISKREHQGTAVGLLPGTLSIPGLIGTPVSGQILLRSGYLGLSIFTGITILAGGIILLMTRLKADRRLLANI